MANINVKGFEARVIGSPSQKRVLVVGNYDGSKLDLELTIGHAEALIASLPGLALFAPKERPLFDEIVRTLKEAVREARA